MGYNSLEEEILSHLGIIAINAEFKAPETFPLILDYSIASEIS